MGGSGATPDASTTSTSFPETLLILKDIIYFTSRPLSGDTVSVIGVIIKLHWPKKIPISIDLYCNYHLYCIILFYILLKQVIRFFGTAIHDFDKYIGVVRCGTCGLLLPIDYLIELYYVSGNAVTIPHPHCGQSYAFRYILHLGLLLG